MDIDAFNAKFAIAGLLRFTKGRGDLPMIEVDTGQARALISVYAGQVLAYQPNSATEDLLFVSERAYFAPGSGIKGGIPICWPWFGPDPEDRGRGGHGFARTLPWTVHACECCPDGSILIRLGLADDENTRASWPYFFNLWLEIRVGTTLRLTLTTRNSGDRPFRITQGLHAYFKVGDATQVRVEGLDGCDYLDKSAGGADAVIRQTGAVTVASEVNRIYEQVPARLYIDDPLLARRIRIDTEHSSTCVVWNPWIDTARAMDDLDDEDYQRFICVETVNTASEVIEVLPNDACRLSAEYQIESLQRD